MTLAIRDHVPESTILVRFDLIATCLEPEAAKYSWRISSIDGMLTSGDGSETLDDAYAEADASLISPISWPALRRWASQFFQIYDCEFHAATATGRGDLKICCIDSAQWEITTGIVRVTKRIRRTFKMTVEVEDVNAN